MHLTVTGVAFMRKTRRNHLACAEGDAAAAAHRVKNVFGRMVAKRMIEQVPGTRTSDTAYRKPFKNPPDDSGESTI